MSIGRHAEHLSSATISFSADTFSLETIKRAAYRFTDRASFEFERKNGEIAVKIAFGSRLSATERDELISDFRNEVLDQDLRRTIAEETATVLNAILAHAFSRTGLQGE